MDASVFYGHTLKLSYELRSFRNGQLKTNKANILYRQPNCTEFCYLVGDARQINNPVLLMQSSLFTRFHNFVAQELSTLNKHWDDETLYQEARRIVIAIYQHIAIDEWLRLIIGRTINILFGSDKLSTKKIQSQFQAKNITIKILLAKEIPSSVDGTVHQ